MKQNCFRAIDPHEKILDSIKKRDSDRGRAEMVRHMDNVFTDIEVIVMNKKMKKTVDKPEKS
jgi:DNA-binding GntR family transcriptional regulator